ncbi:multicopper oxidase family protein, partial [Cribrihabitans sp. XS_ASV171]
MTLDRRQFLAGAAAVAVLPMRAQAGATVIEAREALVQIAPEPYGMTPIWGFDGQAPGPGLRVAQGERLSRRLVNALPQPTSVHWHGIRIDNAMDGVPGLTQDAVQPGDGFDYDFILPDAGTYWYHAHNRSFEQVARGLYGPLVVEEAEAPDVDDDVVLMLDDWRLDPETVMIADDFDNGHDLSHGGRIGNIVTVNGRFDPVIPVRRNARLRLRLVNAANARIFSLGLDGMAGWVIALDGMPLERPEPFGESIVLAPAQRADLIVDVTAETGGIASLVEIQRDGGYGLARFEVGEGAGMSRDMAPVALPPNPLPSLDGWEDAPRHEMRIEGGAMRWLDSAMLGDTRLSGQELAQLGRFWALNGRADRPEDPFLDAARDSL